MADLNAAMRSEWEAWQEVCKALRATNAVTEKDMQTSPNTPGKTPGLKLLIAIRNWGEEKEKLAKAR